MEDSKLTKLSKTLKTEKLIIAVVLIIFLFTFFLIYSLSYKPKTKAPVWNGNIIPGKSTKDEVQSSLGEPIKVDVENGKDSYFYQTQNQYRLNELAFSGSTVDLIKEQVIGKEKGNLKDFVQKYGQYENILYGPHGDIAPGHYWGKQGLLIFAGVHDGIIVEIWYFQPIDLQSFKKQHPELSQDRKEGF